MANDTDVEICDVCHRDRAEYICDECSLPYCGCGPQCDCDQNDID